MGFETPSKLVSPNPRVPIIRVFILRKKPGERSAERTLLDPLVEVVKLLERWHPYVGVPGQVLGQPTSTRSLRSYAQKIRERQKQLPPIYLRFYEAQCNRRPMSWSSRKQWGR